jgi:protein-disulfide isomerase
MRHESRRHVMMIRTTHSGAGMQHSNDIGKEDHVRGPATAALTLIEYGDFRCPYCARAHEALQELDAELGKELGGIRLVFRHLPLTDFHPLAEAAAESAEAAAAQGKFWDMHDALFEQQNEIDDDDDLVDVAGEIGLDDERFVGDMEAQRYRARVRADLERATSLGAHRTPTFYINGKLYSGDSDKESLEQALRGA